MESERASGLVVTDRRWHQRSDPRTHAPNANGQGPNDPPVSVGPTSSEGYGNTHVMYPTDAPHSQAWSGWPVDWDVPPLEPLGTQAYSGEGYGRLNDTMFARVSTAMSAVDLNSRELGSFPVYGMRDSIPFELPTWRLNPEPEIFSSWADFMHSAVNSLLLRGECITYATGHYADGRVARFTTLNPDVVDVEQVAGRRVVTLAGAELPREDVCIVRYQSWPMRIRGISPIEWVGQSLVTAGALERYAGGLAHRGGIPWAVLKSRTNMNATQAADLQARWVAASRRRDGAPAVLGGDFSLEPLTISPRDLSLLEIREFDERRVAAAFGVPAYLLNVAMASGLTYTNAESLFRHHWAATLRPLANLLAEAWSTWLLPHGSRIEFNPDRYTQPPLGERVQAWQTMFNIVDPLTGERAITLDEIRTAERMVPSQLNTAPESDAERLTGAVT